MKNKFLAIMIITFSSVIAAKAQIAQGGTYKLEQSVVAAGGASADASGNLYKLDSVIGEPVAGTTSSAGTYSVKGGFLSSPTIAPTAASVSISGRVLTADGSGLLNARVTLTDPTGNTRTITTRKGGAFSFDDVEAGAVYIIRVGSRRYTFAPQIVSPVENLSEVNFIAEQPTIIN